MEVAKFTVSLEDLRGNADFCFLFKRIFKTDPLTISDEELIGSVNTLVPVAFTNIKDRFQLGYINYLMYNRVWLLVFLEKVKAGKVVAFLDPRDRNYVLTLMEDSLAFLPAYHNGASRGISPLVANLFFSYTRHVFMNKPYNQNPKFLSYIVSVEDLVLGEFIAEYSPTKPLGEYSVWFTIHYMSDFVDEEEYKISLPLNKFNLKELELMFAHRDRSVE